MTVAELIAQRTAALRTILHDSDQAIHAKGGTPADDLSGLQDAILSIPSGGGELPELTTPAEVGHVLAGKEYIDAAGAKKTGTLVVCDSIEEVETIGVPGVGLHVDFESPADGSAGELMLREPDLAAENIVAGSSIFGVQGSAKTLRVETGTITPAEDTTTLSIPCSDNPKYAVITSITENAADGDIIGDVIYNIDYNGLFAGNCVVSYYYGSRIRGTFSVATFDTGINIPEISDARFYRAGTAYQWTAYYWEDVS